MQLAPRPRYLVVLVGQRHFATESLRQVVCSSAFRRLASDDRQNPPKGGTTNRGGAVRLVGLVLVSLLTASLMAQSQPRPNLVLIMCDDMGFSDIGCYGGEVETPNLNRLAREGMRFTQFYNNAKCTTTRASIVTGLYPRFGKEHLRNQHGDARRGTRTSRLLHRSVWQMASGTRRDDASLPPRLPESFTACWMAAATSSTRPSPIRPTRVAACGGLAKTIGSSRSFPRTTTRPTLSRTTPSTRSTTADAAKKPFFVHVTYTCPHYPLHAKPEDIQKYLGKFKMGWEVMRTQRWARQQAMGLTTSAWRLSDTDSKSYSWEEADHQFEDHRMAVYAAMIDRMDQNIGRILTTLRETGHDRDTLVMFLSDNGGCSEEPGGRDPAERIPAPSMTTWRSARPGAGLKTRRSVVTKSWLHEGGITTPFIARWPGRIEPNSINRNVAHIIDLLPTFLELAGHDYPKQFAGHEILPVEGISMAPLLDGKLRQGHEQLAWYWAGNRAVRQGPWKLVWDKLADGQWELYNIDVDRCETENLAQKDPERVAAMSADWFAWADKVGLNVEDGTGQ